MGSKNYQTLELLTLHQRAKQKVAERSRSSASFNKADVYRLAHELEVQHVELELEIEELRRSRAALELRHSELYEFAPIGYFSFDINGTIVQANATAADLLGLPRAKVLGRSLAAFLKEDFRQPFAKFLARMFAGKAKQSCLLPLVEDGGESVLLYVKGLGVASVSRCKVMVIDVSDIDRSLHHSALCATA